VTRTVTVHVGGGIDYSEHVYLPAVFRQPALP
jgi:hypothetical protein